MPVAQAPLDAADLPREAISFHVRAEDYPGETTHDRGKLIVNGDTVKFLIPREPEVRAPGFPSGEDVAAGWREFDILRHVAVTESKNGEITITGDSDMLRDTVGIRHAAVVTIVVRRIKR